jgi:hypothetical protein
MTTEAIYVPIERGGKRPLVTKWSEPDEMPHEWDSLLSSDLEPNLGLRLDGLLVIDCDTAEAAAWWVSVGAPTDCQVKTPHGWHFYYQLPPGVEVQGGALRRPDGTPMRVDVKTGRKHYVLVPPSKTEGGEYHWLQEGVRPDRAPVAPPEALDAIQAVRDAVRTQSAAADAEGGLTAFPEGMRHEMLVQNVGLWRRQGWSDEMIGKVLNGLNHSLMSGNPLPEAEILGIIQSTGSWGEQTIELIAELDENEDAYVFLSNEMEMPAPLPWLWKPWLPEGRLVLLVGDEGIGKGMFSAYCAVRCISGDFGMKAPVLWFSIEDDPKEDIYKRLMAAGYEPDAHEVVHFLNPDKPIGFPTHIPEIEAYIEHTGIKLVIVDPGRSYLQAPEGAELNFNSDVAMRYGLQALNRMAARTGATTLFVHHTNKNAGASTRHRSGGTAAFSQTARHRIDVAKAGTDEWAEWAMAVTKTNYGVEGHLTSYRLEGAPEFDTARFEMGEPLLGYPSIGAWAQKRQAELDSPRVYIIPE